MEIWKDLILRESDEEVNLVLKNRYSVSSYGRVYNKETNKFISHVITGKPSYWYVNLRVGSNKVILRRVHNIMAHTFLGEPPSSKYTCDHIDQNKYNNSLDNLRWLNKKGQMRNRTNSLTTRNGDSLVGISEKYDLPYSKVRLAFHKGFEEEGSLIKESSLLSKYGNFVGEMVIQERGSNIRLVSFLEAFSKTPDEVLPLIRKGFTLTEILEDKTYHTKESLANTDNTKSLEYCGIWYPSPKEALDCLGLPISYWSSSRLEKKTTNEERLQEVLRIKAEDEDRGKFQVGEYFMTIEEHCKRVGTSYGRVSTLIRRKGLNLEEALYYKPVRIIKHTINGEVKRNKAWFEYFNIDSRTANNYLCKHNHDFRKTLEHFGVDTTGMEIEPYI